MRAHHFCVGAALLLLVGVTCAASAVQQERSISQDSFETDLSLAEVESLVTASVAEKPINVGKLVVSAIRGLKVAAKDAKVWKVAKKPVTKAAKALSKAEGKAIKERSGKQKGVGKSKGKGKKGKSVSKKGKGKKGGKKKGKGKKGKGKKGGRKSKAARRKRRSRRSRRRRARRSRRARARARARARRRRLRRQRRRRARLARLRRQRAAAAAAAKRKRVAVAAKKTQPIPANANASKGAATKGGKAASPASSKPKQKVTIVEGKLSKKQGKQKGVVTSKVSGDVRALMAQILDDPDST